MMSNETSESTESKAPAQCTLILGFRNDADVYVASRYHIALCRKYQLLGPDHPIS